MQRVDFKIKDGGGVFRGTAHILETGVLITREGGNETSDGVLVTASGGRLSASSQAGKDEPEDESAGKRTTKKK